MRQKLKPKNPSEKKLARQRCFCLVVSRFNETITNNLLKEAVSCLQENHIPKKSIEVVYVPGAFEIPQMVAKIIQHKKHHAIITLGCVIKGQTFHFDFICASVFYALQQLCIQNSVPILLGILTTKNERQAKRRSRANDFRCNKGREVALAALEMTQQTTRF